MESTYIRLENLKEQWQKANEDYPVYAQNKRKIKLTLDDEKWSFYDLILEINKEDKTNVITKRLQNRLGFMQDLKIYAINQENDEKIYIQDIKEKRVEDLFDDLTKKVRFNGDTLELLFNFESMRTDPIYLTT